MTNNPDQCITEGVKLFTTDVLGYLLVVVNSVVTLAGFVGLLRGISGQLMVGLLVFTGVGTLISVVMDVGSLACTSSGISGGSIAVTALGACVTIRTTLELLVRCAYTCSSIVCTS